MPRRRRHRSPEKGGSGPPRLATAHPRAQSRPPRPGPPRLCGSGAPRAPRPARASPRQPREPRRPTKGQDSSRALLALGRAAGTPSDRAGGAASPGPHTPRAATEALPARRARSPGAGRSLTPPLPRSGSASAAQARAPPSQRGGRRRAVTVTKQSGRRRCQNKSPRGPASGGWAGPGPPLPARRHVQARGRRRVRGRSSRRATPRGHRRGDRRSALEAGRALPAPGHAPCRPPRGLAHARCGAGMPSTWRRAGSGRGGDTRAPRGRGRGRLPPHLHRRGPRDPSAVGGPRLGNSPGKKAGKEPRIPALPSGAPDGSRRRAVARGRGGGRGGAVPVALFRRLGAQLLPNTCACPFGGGLAVRAAGSVQNAWLAGAPRLSVSVASNLEARGQRLRGFRPQLCRPLALCGGTATWLLQASVSSQ